MVPIVVRLPSAIFYRNLSLPLTPPSPSIPPSPLPHVPLLSLVYLERAAPIISVRAASPASALPPDTSTWYHESQCNQQRCVMCNINYKFSAMTYFLKLVLNFPQLLETGFLKSVHIGFPISVWIKFWKLCLLTLPVHQQPLHSIRGWKKYYITWCQDSQTIQLLWYPYTWIHHGYSKGY